MRIIVTLFLYLPVFLCNSQEFQFNLLELMKDAKPIEMVYKVNTAINTPYKVIKAQPYYYSKATGQLTKLPYQSKVNSNNLVFNFMQEPQKEEYLIVKVVYGPNYLFELNSEGYCFTKITGRFVMSEFNCDAYTTARYLLSKAILNDVHEISASIINKMFELQQLPQTQSWQNYQAIIVYFLNHIAEHPEYIGFNEKENYLKKSFLLVNKIYQHFKKNRMISLVNFEDYISEIDPSAENIGYKILSSLSVFHDENQKNLPFVIEHPTYIEDFFSGLSSLTLSDSGSMKLPNLLVEKSKVTFNYWPWFDQVSYQFDNQGIKYTNRHYIDKPVDVKRLYLRPFSGKNRYLKSIVQLDFDNSVQGGRTDD
jgi:hypothetical protein